MLQEYGFSISHIPVKNNIIVDMLSSSVQALFCYLLLEIKLRRYLLKVGIFSKFTCMCIFIYSVNNLSACGRISLLVQYSYLYFCFCEYLNPMHFVVFN